MPEIKYSSSMDDIGGITSDTLQQAAKAMEEYVRRYTLAAGHAMIDEMEKRMSEPKLESQTEEYIPQVGDRQGSLAFEVDPETKSILTEEAIKLTERLNRICIQLMKAEPDRRTVLHCIASYLQLNVIELKAYLNQP